MEKEKVISQLREWAEDPFDSKICLKLISVLEDTPTPTGKIIIRLLALAERWEFIK